jgi:hypothetical protein
LRLRVRGYGEQRDGCEGRKKESGVTIHVLFSLSDPLDRTF